MGNCFEQREGFRRLISSCQLPGFSLKLSVGFPEKFKIIEKSNGLNGLNFQNALRSSHSFEFIA